MPARKRSSKAPAAPAVVHEVSTWIVSFEADEVALGEDEDVNFEVLVQAADVHAAIELSRSRIKELRATTTLFDPPCTVYLRSVIRVPTTIVTPPLVNWKSQTCGGLKSVLSCELPEQADVELDVYSNSPDEAGDYEREVFLKFE